MTFPVGVRWRSSVSFATFVVGLVIACDLLVYSIVIPVLPFRLENMGYRRPSALAGWLIFAYSGGLVVSTIPIAMLSERYSVRRLPMIGGLFALLAAQILLMLARTYWVMCVARILQGISSSVVWVVGLAMLCDTTPEKHIGRQLGIAIMGLSVGLVMGPPIGGVLYGRYGFHAPFIFSIAVTCLDLLARLVFMERKDALRYGIDPAALPAGDLERSSSLREDATRSNSPDDQTLRTPQDDVHEKPSNHTSNTNVAEAQGLSTSPSLTDQTIAAEANAVIPPPRSLLSVMGALLKSPRAVAAMVITCVYGIVYTAQEPTLPLRLQFAYHLNSTQVGLTLLASIVPTLFASPITGWLTDRNGAAWVTFLSLLLSLPWWAIVVARRPFPLFVAGFAIECFFTSGVVSPVTAELAAVSRGIEGVGYAHVYAAFNIAYGIGTAAGPVLGGQIYTHVRHGWEVLCQVSVALLMASMFISFIYVGEVPLFERLVRGHRTVKVKPVDIVHDDNIALPPIPKP